MKEKKFLMLIIILGTFKMVQIKEPKKEQVCFLTRPFSQKNISSLIFENESVLKKNQVVEISQNNFIAYINKSFINEKEEKKFFKVKEPKGETPKTEKKEKSDKKKKSKKDSFFSTWIKPIFKIFLKSWVSTLVKLILIEITENTSNKIIKGIMKFISKLITNILCNMLTYAFTQYIIKKLISKIKSKVQKLMSETIKKLLVKFSLKKISVDISKPICKTIVRQIPIKKTRKYIYSSLKINSSFKKVRKFYKKKIKKRFRKFMKKKKCKKMFKVKEKIVKFEEIIGTESVVHNKNYEKENNFKIKKTKKELKKQKKVLNRQKIKKLKQTESLLNKTSKESLSTSSKTISGINKQINDKKENFVQIVQNAKKVISFKSFDITQREQLKKKLILRLKNIFEKKENKKIMQDIKTSVKKISSVKNEDDLELFFSNIFNQSSIFLIIIASLFNCNLFEYSKKIL